SRYEWFWRRRVHIELIPFRQRQLDTLRSEFSHPPPNPTWIVAGAGGEVRVLHMAVPLLIVAAMPAPAVAHANPVDDYVVRNGNAVCAALDKAQDGGDIFRLVLTIRHDG